MENKNRDFLSLIGNDIMFLGHKIGTLTPNGVPPEVMSRVMEMLEPPEVTEDFYDEDKVSYEKTLLRVDWTLPGMEKIGDDATRWLVRLIREGQFVNSVHCLGWAFWPTKNGGYLDERTLRVLADFIEIQNRPFWDAFEAAGKEDELRDSGEGAAIFYDG